MQSVVQLVCVLLWVLHLKGENVGLPHVADLARQEVDEPVLGSYAGRITMKEKRCTTILQQRYQCGKAVVANCVVYSHSRGMAPVVPQEPVLG